MNLRDVGSETSVNDTVQTSKMINNIYIYIKSMGIYQPENLMSNGSSRHDDAAQTK